MHPDTRPSAARRILLHSHDSYGLGHLRRTLTLAGALAGGIEDCAVLIVSGSPCASHFSVPAGVDVVKLPAATKDAAGAYASRTLPFDMRGLTRLRAGIVREVFAGFDPDLFIVDHQPLGLAGELRVVLRDARERGVTTVLGLRDVIDEPRAVAEQWGQPDVRAALREGYDRVVVYGAPEVFDPRAEYPIPRELSERVEFAGYVVRPCELRGERPPHGRPQVLVTLGGGEDGEARVRTYLDAVGDGVPWDTTIVLGPLMHPDRARHFKRCARRMGHVRVRGFYSDLPRLYAESDAVVAMAGYNTVAEVLQARIPSVLLPRTHPRKEQFIRAQALERLGLARMLVDPRPRELLAAVEQALTSRPDWECVPSLEGRDRMAALASELLEPRGRAREACAG